jgi:ureidoacrylate peracid hydrolase
MNDERIEEKIAFELKSRKSALIAVDVQNDFCHSQGVFAKRGFELSHVETAVDNLLLFVDHCRKLNFPIIFVRTVHSSWTDSDAWIGRLEGAAREMPICRPDSRGADFYKVKPEGRDFIVTKHRFSGFVGTDLDLVLRSRGIETLLMTGVATNVCVETTARDAFNLGYRIVLVEDCCGAFSSDEHASTITNISKYFGIVANSRVIAACMKL